MEYTFNPPKYVIETIGKRKSILLDTSVWIFLADGKDNEAVELREKMIRLSRKEAIFCPLSAPTIWELKKQSGASLHRTAELMEELSLNVSYRGLDDIFDREVSHFLSYLLDGQFLPLEPGERYGTLLSYLSHSFFLKPSPDPSEYVSRHLYKHLSETICSISLTGFINLLGEYSFPNVNRTSNYQEANLNRRRISRGSNEKMRRIEQEYVANSILIPKLNAQRTKLPIDQQLYIVAKVNALPRDKQYDSAVSHILKFMPALSAYVEMLTVSGYDVNRKDKPNDFFDREFLVYGLSYSSIFVTLDGWVTNLIELCRKNRFPGSLGYVGSISALRACVEKIEMQI